MSALTVVVPAHDEETLIGGMVGHLLENAGGDIQAVVVANGCTDHTADRARAAGAVVAEIAEASKISALNAATELVTRYPVAYVDADVRVSGADLLDLAGRLAASGTLVGAPRMQVAPSRSWWVRQYYRVWALTDYRSTGHIGSGVYLLSAEGRARFGAFPTVIADDLFVQRLFEESERCTPDDLSFEVSAPGSLRALVRRNTRIAAGNRQIALLFPDLAPPTASAGAKALVPRVAARPGLWAGFVVYATVYTLTRRRARRLIARQAPVAWNRDESTRKAPR